MAPTIRYNHLMDLILCFSMVFTLLQSDIYIYIYIYIEKVYDNLKFFSIYRIKIYSSDGLNLSLYHILLINMIVK